MSETSQPDSLLRSVRVDPRVDQATGSILLGADVINEDSLSSVRHSLSGHFLVFFLLLFLFLLQVLSLTNTHLCPRYGLAAAHKQADEQLNKYRGSRNGSTRLTIGGDRCSIGWSALSRIDTSVFSWGTAGGRRSGWDLFILHWENWNVCFGGVPPPARADWRSAGSRWELWGRSPPPPPVTAFYHKWLQLPCPPQSLALPPLPSPVGDNRPANRHFHHPIANHWSI